MGEKEKKRLDILVLEKFPNLSRSYIQDNLILAGKVKVSGKIITKPGVLVYVDSKIDVDFSEPKYVSRAGFKLEKALDYFKLDVCGLIVLDAGVSTGGFSDCLLQRGVKRIYGVDVGHGQTAEKLINDSKLVLIEKTNIRNLEKLAELVDLITLDLSFISTLKVIDNVVKFLKKNGKIIILIKPQFEVQPQEVGRGGIVKDEKIHKKVIEKFKNKMGELGFIFNGAVESPVASDNKEFLALFERWSDPRGWARGI